jgi:hypothetical protein
MEKIYEFSRAQWKEFYDIIEQYEPGLPEWYKQVIIKAIENSGPEKVKEICNKNIENTSRDIESVFGKNQITENN